MPIEPFLTSREVSRRLRLGLPAISALAKSGKIRALRLASRWLFYKDGVDRLAALSRPALEAVISDAMKTKQRAAVNLLNRAVAAGQIIPPENCEKCGKKAGRINGHHETYDKPLDVTWLCDSCHRTLHRAPSPLPVSDTGQSLVNPDLNQGMSPEAQADTGREDMTAEELRAWMRDHDAFGTRLAEVVGCSSQCIYDWLKGRRPVSRMLPLALRAIEDDPVLRELVQTRKEGARPSPSVYLPALSPLQAANAEALRPLLPEKERDILDRRLIARDASLSQVGAMHGLTRERIRQIQDRLFIRLSYPASTVEV